MNISMMSFSMALAHVKAGRKVVFLDYEMSSDEVAARITSRVLGYEASGMSGGSALAGTSPPPVPTAAS